MRLNYIDNCDCLDGLKEIPDKSVDLVVTDPPYGIGIKSQGSTKAGAGAKLNPWADMCNASLWYSVWLQECKRIIKDDGAVWSFINWRYFTTLQKAGLDIGWDIASLLIWDKCWIGPGVKYLRPAYEQVALFAGPEFKIENRSLADIQRFKWGSFKPTGHPAEKPLDLIRWLIQTSGKKDGAVIVDPFSGSGTTACAAIFEGCNYIGFEMDSNWAKKSEQRIAETVDQLLLE